MTNKSLTKNTEFDDITSKLTSIYTKQHILKKARNYVDKIGCNKPEIESTDEIRDLMKVDEFNSGIHLLSVLHEDYRPFAIEFRDNLYKEYKCDTPSKKALAESATLNFCQSMRMQEEIQIYLSRRQFTDIGVTYINVLSKELDKSHRRFLVTLQTLKNFNVPPLNINLKATTANIANNQLIKEEHVITSK